MPAIPAMSLAATELDVEEIYQSVFDPTQATPNSFDVLNGGLDANNAASLSKWAPAYAFQPGTFVAGQYIGFDRWEFCYGKQLADSDAGWVVSAGLATRVFKPWDANFLIIGYEAWVRQELGLYEDANEQEAWNLNEKESWRLRMNINGTAYAGLDATIPHNKKTNEYDTLTELGPGHESRYRFVSKVHAFKRGVAADTLMDRGYLTFRIHSRANLYNPKPATEEYDKFNAHIIIPAGGLWVMAFR